MDLHFAKRGANAGERIRALMRKTGKTPWGADLWTEPEDDLLRLHHPDFDRLALLLPKRTWRAIRARCGKLNITYGHKPWTGREISLLRRLWSSATRTDIKAAFPERSWVSLYRAAERQGFKRPRRRYATVPSAHVNAIRDRCFELGYTLKDIDELAKTKGFFNKGGSYNPRPDMRKIHRAIKALDGEVVVVWHD